MRVDPLVGGLRNTSLLLRFAEPPHQAVLRIYREYPSAAQKEADLLPRLRSFIPVPIPVPEVLLASSAWLLLEYIEGITLRELKRTGDRDAVAQAAYSVGEILARFPHNLVHGDFGKSNIIVRRDPEGVWRVSAIIDWELAGEGSPFIDIGHFLRYERLAKPLLEPHFSEGYRNAGGLLPPDWRRRACLADLERLHADLAKPDLPDDVRTELLELVTSNRQTQDALQ